jgi:hypothetical protein
MIGTAAVPKDRTDGTYDLGDDAAKAARYDG